jgi:hypothetical protein
MARRLQTLLARALDDADQAHGRETVALDALERMACVELSAAAIGDLKELIGTGRRPGDTRVRVTRSLKTLER